MSKIICDICGTTYPSSAECCPICGCSNDVAEDLLGAETLCDDILEENDYEMLFVINKFRPLTSDTAGTLEVMNEIETACKIKFTGIVNNSNLGEDTTAEDVLESQAYADSIAEASGLPIKMTTVSAKLYDELKSKINNLMPLNLYIRQSWQK